MLWAEAIILSPATAMKSRTVSRPARLSPPQAASRCSMSRACCVWTAGRASRPPPASQVGPALLNIPPRLPDSPQPAHEAGLPACQVSGCNIRLPGLLAGAVCQHAIRLLAAPPPPLSVLVRELRNEVSRLLAAKVGVHAGCR